MTGSDDNREENAGHIPHDMRGSDDSGADIPECEGHGTQLVYENRFDLWYCPDCEGGVIPITELEQLADEFIQQRTGHAEVDQAYENAGSRIYRLIADYRGDKRE